MTEKESENSPKTGINSPDLPRLAYTMEETADLLGVSYITVHRLLKRGLLRSSNALRHKLIPRTEIERFLAETLSVSRPGRATETARTNGHNPSHQ